MGRFSLLSPALAPSRASTTITLFGIIPPAGPHAKPHLIQHRSAKFIPRPRRPYTFTQLVQLSDGSTYTRRTTSPVPLLRTQKDTRNAILWQPSEKGLRNVEEDEAGKLAAFRGRFGSSFDAATSASSDGDRKDKAAATTGEEQGGEEVGEGEDKSGSDIFADLITGYAPKDTGSMKDVKVRRKKK